MYIPPTGGRQRVAGMEEKKNIKNNLRFYLMDTDCWDQFTPSEAISVDSWSFVWALWGWWVESYWLQRSIWRLLLLLRDPTLWKYLESESSTILIFTDPPPALHPPTPQIHSPVDSLCYTSRLQAMQWVRCVCGEGQLELFTDLSMLCGVTYKKKWMHFFSILAKSNPLNKKKGN